MSLALALAAALCPPIATLPSDRQRQAVDDALQAGAVTVSLSLAGSGVTHPFGLAYGLADPGTGRAMTPDTPLRIASNTKTFVAATVLRLHEQGRLALEDSIVPLLSTASREALRGDGHVPERIRVEHLLAHTAGLYDHGADPRFIASVMARPDRVWQRSDLIELAMGYADPQSAPGEEFRYSDTGYVLLGEIIERVTGLTLAQAVRAELGLDRLGLGSTWWEVAESPPPGSPPRARQYIDGVDASDLHPSFDLHGGGGLVMSTDDLARFMAALFEGRIFDRPQTLARMLEAGRHRDAAQYRLGLFAKSIEGREVYSHSGFWGTVAFYDPATRRAVAAATSQREQFRSVALPVAESVLGFEPEGCR